MNIQAIIDYLSDNPQKKMALILSNANVVVGTMLRPNPCSSFENKNSWILERDRDTDCMLDGKDIVSIFPFLT